MLRVSTSVSSIRSGVTVSGDDVSGTSTSTGVIRATVAAGAVFRAGLKIDLFRLTDLDLLGILDLLKVLARLKALVVGALIADISAAGA